MFDWNTMIVEPLQAMLTQAASFVPSLVGAIIILIVGWIIARILQFISGRFLKLIRFDTAAQKAGISSALERGGVKYTTSSLVGRLVYWIVMILVLVMAVNALGLSAASELLNRILLYIPQVIAAIFIIVLGLFLGSFVAGIVQVTASNAGVERSELLGQLARLAIVVFTVAMALEQLKFATTIVSSAFVIVFGAIFLALALAFGLGCRDIAGRYIANLIERQTKKTE